MIRVIITCEHGGNQIPSIYRHCFSEAGDVLDTHRAIDKGGLDLFHSLKLLADFVNYSETCRLLVDLNRSLDSPTLFSEFTRNLPEADKNKIISEYYNPYRNAVCEKTTMFITEGSHVVHISVHSFAPLLNNEVRKNDIGLLFDPSKKSEVRFSELWADAVKYNDPSIIVMYNYPYTGTGDGLPKTLREAFPDNYTGIELEVNQRFAAGDKMNKQIKNMLFITLKETLKKVNDKIPE